ncbi:MAG: dipeptidase, partial [bacterium]|nr:dipeptidase [bacterium]
DGNYGIANEHNLMMGECTSAARYQPDAVTEEEVTPTKHGRFLYSDELSRIALERCKTAEHAVRLMGALIDKYGFFSYGETLLVVDDTEGWVFEMCALPDEEFHSAWVAQRVPDGEMFVAANTFRIRDVHPESSDFRCSKHLFKGLERVKYWNPDEGTLDWMRAVSPGEYGHPYYSLRRIWRVYDRVNPDLGLSPWVKGGGYTQDYPFSVKPKRPLELR